MLVKTSNPSSAEIQDLEHGSGRAACTARVAELVNPGARAREGAQGYRSVGAVVGGRIPRQGVELRAQMPGVPLLVPGYGAQGARADDLAGMFDAAGTGAVVNSSRAILYAYRKRSGPALAGRRAPRSAGDEGRAVEGGRPWIEASQTYQIYKTAEPLYCISHPLGVAGHSGRRRERPGVRRSDSRPRGAQRADPCARTTQSTVLISALGGCRGQAGLRRRSSS